MSKVTKVFDRNNWRLPLTIGKNEDDAKKIRVRWYKKDGSTESDPAIDISNDESYKIKLFESVEKRKSDKFRIETLDESGKQIGSESFSHSDPAAPPPAPTAPDLEEVQPMPDPATAPPAPTAPPTPAPTIRAPDRLPLDEVQNQAYTNLLLAKLLEGQTTHGQRTIEKLLDSNTRMADALLREKSGTQYVEKMLQLIDDKEKALERASMAEAALAVETNRPKDEKKTDPLKSVTELFKTLKDKIPPEEIVMEAIKAMKEGRTDTIIETLKKINYNDRIEAVSGFFILCAKATPADQHATMLSDCIALVQKKAAG